MLEEIYSYLEFEQVSERRMECVECFAISRLGNACVVQICYSREIDLEHMRNDKGVNQQTMWIKYRSRETKEIDGRKDIRREKLGMPINRKSAEYKALNNPIRMTEGEKNRLA